MLEKIKRVHFIDIGGITMSSLAIELKKKGITVTGSEDILYDPSKSLLEKNNLLPEKEGYFKNKITKDIDLVISHQDKCEEYEEALKQKIPVLSYPAFLSKILEKYEVICIAGTYGKTTTTSLITWILHNAKTNPSYLIGGIPKNLSDNLRITEGKYFVIEGDEYKSASFDRKPKFMYYNPKYLIITGIEMDHIDFFPTFHEYKKAFYDLVNSLNKNSHIIACKDNKEVVSLLNQVDHEINVDFYSIKEAKNIFLEKEKTSFNYYGRLIKSNLLGEHNILNTIAAIKTCKKIGIPEKKIIEAIENFEGVKKRQELLFKGQIKIFEDFAHHPAKVRETIKAIKNSNPEKRVWAIFEPKTYSSLNKTFIEKYKSSFDYADKIILYDSKEKKKQTNPATAYDYVDFLKNCKIFDEPEKMVNYLLENTKRDDIFLFMSSGNFENAINLFIERSKNLF